MLTCANCNIAFLREAARGRIPKFCSAGCKAENDARARRKPQPVSLCAACGSKNPAVTKGAPRVYCSVACRRSKAAQARFSLRCAECRNSFFGEHPERRFCSRACASVAGNRVQWESHEPAPVSNGHKARARRYGVKYEHVPSLVVFERDCWVCALCLLPVDQDLKWPDPGSASLDHTVPISKGGAHTIDNLRCTHLRCNIVKGARIDARSAPEAKRAEAPARKPR
jgi:5-methylcytosine-specific restriction endonuclease McrA